MDTTPDNPNSFLKGWTNEAWAFLLLRLWLGLRAFVTGLEKFSGPLTETRTDEFTGLEETVIIKEKAYGLDLYKAIPDSLKEQFDSQPLLLDFMTGPFYALLGYVLVLSGLLLLLGVCMRTSLVIMGLLYISLTMGLILIKQDAGVAWLATHMLLIAGALILEKNKKLFIFGKY